MALDLKGGISQVKEALSPSTGPNNTPGIAPVFGGGGTATMSQDAYANLASSTFYGMGAKPHGMSVSVGQAGTEMPRSIVSDYSLFNFTGMHYGLDSAAPTSDYFDKGMTNGSTLQGGISARQVSVAKIIEKFGSEEWKHIRYKISDFVYGKYYKKIPPNHMITLRRFAMPCFDNIYDLKIRPKGSKDGEVPGTFPSSYTAVTYLGESAGNPMSEILKFTYGLSYKEIKGEMEEKSTGDKGYTSQPFYSKIGGVGRAVADSFKGVKAGDKFRQQNFTTEDALGTTYANFVLGPVNVVNKTQIRSEAGLHFSNPLTLTFEYDLKSLSYVNPKIAMIDVMVNMMSMTYNSAQFFGGGQRFYGAAGYVGAQFGDINKLRQGDFSGYVGSVVKDVSIGMSNVFGDGKGGFSPQSLLGGALVAGKNLLGNMLGNFLGSQVGSATGTFATKAFISAEPTGDWHVTVGNPLNPIVMMGNMCCNTATMTLGEGLGLDDFPVEAKFEIGLIHGKPRDKGDMENMFNMGRGRIYAAAQGDSDILALEGTPGYTMYGCIDPGGKQSLEKSAQMQAIEAARAGGQTTEGNPNGLAPKAGNMQGSDILSTIGKERGVSPQLISSIIQMTTDS